MWTLLTDPEEVKAAIEKRAAQRRAEARRRDERFKELMDNADAGSAGETGAAAAATPTTPIAAAGGGPAAARALAVAAARDRGFGGAAPRRGPPPASRTGSRGWVIGFIDVLDVDVTLLGYPHGRAPWGEGACALTWAVGGGRNLLS